MKYNPTLDSLRAIAILLVMFFHFEIPGFRHGWIGVDIFFVISGYLITKLLVSEYEKNGTIGLKVFYVRRALRLFPALAVALACYWLWFQVILGQNIYKPVLAAAFYSSNILVVLNGLESLAPLAITWSLSVEEQFYFVWPPLLLCALRQGRKKSLIWIVALLCVSAMLVRFILIEDDESIIARTFWTRPDRILIGCVVALLKIDIPQIRQLEIRPLVWIGKISYSLYLWHPLSMYVAGRMAGSAVLHYPPYLPLLFVVSFASAACSYYLIERPFLRLKDRFQPRMPAKHQT